MSSSDFERARRADRRAVIQMARRTLADLSDYLIEAKLAHYERRTPTRIVRKTKHDALIMPRNRLRYHVTDNARYR